MQYVNTLDLLSALKLTLIIKVGFRWQKSRKSTGQFHCRYFRTGNASSKYKTWNSTSIRATHDVTRQRATEREPTVPTRAAPPPSADARAPGKHARNGGQAAVYVHKVGAQHPVVPGTSVPRPGHPAGRDVERALHPVRRPVVPQRRRR